MSALTLRPATRYQHQDELERFVRFCQANGVRRYLEIGSRWGDSFHAVMSNLPTGSFGAFIDLPESPDKAASLTSTAAELRLMGHAVAGFMGSSRDAAALNFAKRNGPYDLIFIDGDHTYEGVAADWADYRELAPIVALHDVNAPDTWMSDGKPNGVGRFWRELKARGGFKKVVEYITPSDRPMGYGIGVVMTVTNPTNEVEPDWLGQMFFDPLSNVFYQARGPDAADWVFVPPADMVGSMVKIYDQFYGVPEDDPKDAGAAQRYADATLVRNTMAMSGVEVLGLGGLRWLTARGIDVFMVRLRFSEVDGFVLFAGFTTEAVVHAMPGGIGFEMSNGFLRFGGNAREIAKGKIAVLRIEAWRALDDGEWFSMVTAFVDDEPLGAVRIKERLLCTLSCLPVVALFDVGPGPRPVARGYDRMLERKTKPPCEHSACYPVNHPFPGGPTHWKCSQCHQVVRAATGTEVERIGKNDYRRDEEMPR